MSNLSELIDDVMDAIIDCPYTITNSSMTIYKKSENADGNSLTELRHRIKASIRKRLRAIEEKGEQVTLG